MMDQNQDVARQMVVLCSNGDAGVKQWLVCLQGGDDGHANGEEL